MKFFKCLESLNQYSGQLGHIILDKACAYCQSFQKWVSHGFVYKKSQGGAKVITGRRMLCSNRNRKNGCGRTLRLYLAERTPKLHYSVNALFVFIHSMTKMTIAQAYKTATGCKSARNAYRWLSKIMVNLSHYRAQITSQTTQEKIRKTSQRLCLISETFSGLIEQFGQGEDYQLTTQQSLIPTEI